MRKYLVFILFFFFCLPVIAEQAVKIHSNMPQGIFKKKRNGEFVQYDKNGKKIGVYKISNRKCVKVK